ncbi:MAG: hypothetical protein FJ290_24200 [Planctomycetes bacterium]|nr:hypothetical protein [Planctomycetota bacterium]
MVDAAAAWAYAGDAMRKHYDFSKMKGEKNPYTKLLPACSEREKKASVAAGGRVYIPARGRRTRPKHTRRQTLAEVAELTLSGDSFDRCLANFLDGFYAAPGAAALAPTPPLLAPHFEDRGRVQDAYLAATAEELARRFDLPVPAWTAGQERALHRPWFASPLAALRAILLVESPPSFRARNLFVSENALTRV